jgi:hypothetical protein
MEKNKKREDLDGAYTDRKGMGGFFEFFMRRFRVVSFVFALVPMYVLCILSMGIAAAPGIFLFSFILEATAGWSPVGHYLMLGVGFVSAYFIYGISLIFVVPLFNLILRPWLHPFRGNYYSLSSIPWYYHNALTYSVRYTFLEFVTPTPINMLFYKMMGMKIGKGAHINSTNISDPAFIEIGEKVTIGGSATIIAHYASKGYLIVDRVKIHDRVTVGIKATIMGDVEIGEKAVIAPHEVVLPKSRIPEGRR